MVGKQPKRAARTGVDRYGRSPLHNAVLEGSVELSKRHILEGVSVDAADDNGWTALHFAARDWQEELCRLLLDAGANPNLQDSDGNTPLFRCLFSSRGRGDVITLLRERGADPLLKNASGVSPVSLARTVANFDVAQFFTDVPSSE